MDAWTFAIELRGVLAQIVAPDGEAAAVARDDRICDVSAAAARAGVAEGMTVRAALLRLPALRLETVTAEQVDAARERLRSGLSALSDDVRCDGGGRSALLRFLALPPAALGAPWTDACARLVPAWGFALEGAVGPSAWAARALLAAARAGAVGVQRLAAPGGQLVYGDWRGLAVTVMADVPPADQERLRRQGLRTLGQLASLPAARRRLLVGPLWARRLEGGNVSDGEDAGKEAAEEEKRERTTVRVDGAPGEAGGLATALGQAAAEVAARLGRRGEGVRRIDLALVPETGEEMCLERSFLVPLPPPRLAGAAASLVWTHARLTRPIATLRLTVTGAPMGWAQIRLNGRRRAPPAWTLPVERLAVPARSRRLRREARLSLWDPLRGGSGDAPAR